MLVPKGKIIVKLKSTKNVVVGLCVKEILQTMSVILNSEGWEFTPAFLSNGLNKTLAEKCDLYSQEETNINDSWAFLKGLEQSNLLTITVELDFTSKYSSINS